MIENSSMTNTHPNSSAEKCKPWFSSLLAVVLSKKMNFISHRQSSSGTKWPGRKKWWLPYAWSHEKSIRIRAQTNVCSRRWCCCCWSVIGKFSSAFAHLTFPDHHPDQLSPTHTDNSLSLFFLVATRRCACVGILEQTQLPNRPKSGNQKTHRHFRTRVAGWCVRTDMRESDASGMKQAVTVWWWTVIITGHCQLKTTTKTVSDYWNRKEEGRKIIES